MFLTTNNETNVLIVKYYVFIKILGMTHSIKKKKFLNLVDLCIIYTVSYRTKKRNKPLKVKKKTLLNVILNIYLLM
jgi:hypothetical protein